MKFSRWMASSVLCAVILVVSLYGCYSFIRMPLTRSKNTVDLRYTQTAEYGYTAFVEPSLLYDNRTEISEGEPLYTKLVERLEINFQYDLKQDPGRVEITDRKVRDGVSGVLSGGDWKKTYPLELTRTRVYSFAENYTLYMEEIEEIVDTIGEETGTRAHSYIYEIMPEIGFEGLAGNRTVKLELAPTLTIKFEGGKIEFEGLSYSKTDSLTHREEVVSTWRLLGWMIDVDDMRGLSIIAAGLFSGLLFYSGRNTLRERESRTFMERLSEEVREKIVEVKVQEPWESTARETMRVNSLEDLARVAEESFKTIIHHGDVFYVLDGDVRYEYKIEAESDVEDEKID